jgi:hypothetical protein
VLLALAAVPVPVPVALPKPLGSLTAGSTVTGRALAVWQSSLRQSRCQ